MPESYIPLMLQRGVYQFDPLSFMRLHFDPKRLVPTRPEKSFDANSSDSGQVQPGQIDCDRPSNPGQANRSSLSQEGDGEGEEWVAGERER